MMVTLNLRKTKQTDVRARAAVSISLPSTVGPQGRIAIGAQDRVKSSWRCAQYIGLSQSRKKGDNLT
jgi:hypothetical protein